jgi:hypothetical protein
MLTNKTMAALFTIAIASSLIAVNGIVGSTFAFTKSNDVTTSRTINFDGKDKSDSQKSDSANTGDSSGTTGDSSGIPAKDLKSLSKCESGAAADGDLTEAEVTSCYRQVF